jgi:hypothetical protein
MAVYLDKFQIVEIESKDRLRPKRLKKYLHDCNKCGKERGYFIRTHDKSTKNAGLCHSCVALALPPKSEITRQRISETRQRLHLGGKLRPSFAGFKHTEESKQKMRIAAFNRKPYSGWHHSEAARQKMSCTRRGLSLNEFNFFSTSEEETQRALFKTQGLHWRCFELSNYCCQVCCQFRSSILTLHAHHKDGWNWAIEKRFDIANLVALCEKCHSEFHRIFGRGNNTAEQFEEFLCQKQKDEPQKLPSS